MFDSVPADLLTKDGLLAGEVVRLTGERVGEGERLDGVEPTLAPADPRATDERGERLTGEEDRSGCRTVDLGETGSNEADVLLLRGEPTVEAPTVAPAGVISRGVRRLGETGSTSGCWRDLRTGELIDILSRAINLSKVSQITQMSVRRTTSGQDRRGRASPKRTPSPAPEEVWRPSFKPVILKPSQVSAAEGMFKSCVVHGMTYTSTPTGGGKTPLSMWLVQKMMTALEDNDINTMVIGPTSLGLDKEKSPWRRESNRYNMNIDMYLPYEIIRGSSAGSRGRPIITGYMPKIEGQRAAKGYDNIGENFTWIDNVEQDEYAPSDDMYLSTYSDMNGLIMRKDRRTEDGKVISEFSPTMQLMELFMRKRWFIFVEELHSTKNNTITNNATAAVLRAARRAANHKGGSVWIVMLSASPLDSDKNALNFFKLIGMRDPVRSGNLHDMFVTSNPWLLDNARIQAADFTPTCSNIITSETKATSKASEVHKRAAELLDKCVMSKIHFAALEITPKQLWNAFLEIVSEDDNERIRQAEAKLKEVKTLQQKGARHYKEAFKLLGEARQLTEIAIAEAMALDAVARLRSDPNCKCLIVFDFIASVNRAISVLQRYGFYVGGTVARVAGVNSSADDLMDSMKASTSKDTDAAISKFQENNNQLRVVVGIASRISTGIDAHDIHGGHQRHTLTPANYDRLKMEQIFGRTPRIGSKSIPQILVCYPKQLGELIMSIYSSYQTKSKVLSRTLGTRITATSTPEERIIHEDLVKTPDKYDVYIQLKCPDLSYYKGSASYNYETKKVEPADEENYFWVGENTEQGRADFHNIKFMIDYLTKQCRLPESDRDSLDGIIFTRPKSSSINPENRSTVDVDED